MRDGDWYLGYYSWEKLPGAALTFGRMDSSIYCLSEPDVAFSDPEAGDANLPGEDGIRFGRDYQRQATVTFELGVDTVDAPAYRHTVPPSAQGRRIGDFESNWRPGTSGRWQQNLDGVGMLRQVWRADVLRHRPARVAWLERRTGGRTRRLYGRPRKFEVAHSRLTRQGYTPVICTFVAFDDRFYTPERTGELWINDTSGSYPRPGRPAAERPPVSQTKTRLMVAGQAPTYPVVTIHGPTKNPKVSIGGLWEVQLSMTIGAREYVTIDARPWRRDVLKTSGSAVIGETSVADKLTRASPRLGEMYLPPGVWMATLSHTSIAPGSTSGPRVTIMWRDAYTWW
ncbi:hypothetical protein [Streptomyces scopuliridis]|uniref:hypothetical protein n=1 Tax=Streptomyces scopuliridis TaxID=452529 RepID=UPI003696B1E3